MKKIFIFLSLCCCIFLYGEKYLPGIAKKALRNRLTVDYDYKKITPKRGSLLFWVKLDKDAKLLKNAIPLCLGNNKNGWAYCSISNGEFKFSVRTQNRFESIGCKVDEFLADTWYHIAIVWGVRKNGGFARIYINGKLKSYQKITLGESFSSSKLALNYNSGNYKSPTFPGLIDEVFLFDAPILEETINSIYQTNKLGKNIENLPLGALLYLPFEDGKNFLTSNATPEKEAKILLRKAAKSVKIKKYPNEVDFLYSFSKPIEEKIPNSLNDGNNNTGIRWHNTQLSIIGEFDRTINAEKIEIVTRKYTKWYLIKQIRVSYDDGSGNFGEPVIINAFAYNKPISKKTIDATCKEYIYTVPNLGKMCRFKLEIVNDAYGCINEIRVCENK